MNIGDQSERQSLLCVVQIDGALCRDCVNHSISQRNHRRGLTLAQFKQQWAEANSNSVVIWRWQNNCGSRAKRETLKSFDFDTFATNSLFQIVPGVDVGRVDRLSTWALNFRNSRRHNDQRPFGTEAQASEERLKRVIVEQPNTLLEQVTVFRHWQHGLVVALDVPLALNIKHAKVSVSA